MPSFKKIISAVCAAAIVSVSTLVPVMAAGTPVYDEDFSTFTTDTLVDMGNNENTSYDGYEFHCGSRNSGQDQLSISVANDAAKGNYLKFYGTNGMNVAARRMYVDLTKGKTMTVNNSLYISADVYIDVADAGFTFSDGTTDLDVLFKTLGWHSIAIVSNSAGTTITDTPDSGATVTTASDKVLTKLTRISASLGNISLGLTNLLVMDAIVPTIVMENPGRIEAGARVKVANVKDADGSITVTLSNPSDFEYDIDGNDVYVTAKDSISSAATTTVTVAATADLPAESSTTVTAIPAADFAQAIADELELTGSSVTKTGENAYSISGPITVPRKSGEADIAWKSSDESIVTISANEVAPAAAEGTATVTATVTYKGNTATKTFTLTVTSYQEYYNENFDSWGTGDIVRIGPTAGFDNTSHKNWTFATGSRNDGGGTYVAVTDKDSNKYLSGSSEFSSDNRGARIALTNAPEPSALSGSVLVTSFKYMVNNAEMTTTLSDGSADAIGDGQLILNASDMGLTKDVWYDVSYIMTIPGSAATTIVKDASGNTVYLKSEKKSPATISRIDFSYGINSTNVANIDDFKLYKTSSFAVPQITKNDVDVIFKGNKAEVATISGADADKCSVRLSDSTNFRAAIDNGVVTVEALASAASGATTTVTINAATDDISVNAVMDIVTLAQQDIVDAEKALPVALYYKSDAKGVVVKPSAENGAVIFSDLSFPTSSSVTYAGKTYSVNIQWAVAEGEEFISKDGVITVPDKEAHAVKLTRTASYGGASDTKTYDMTVKFDPTEVEAAVKAAVAAAPASAKAEEDAYLREFLYENQVKLDKALAANFAGIPTSVSSSTSFDLPKTGLFGSQLTWYSSNTAVIGVSNSNSKATVTQPSDTTSVMLTAGVSAGTAGTENATVTISVAGSGRGGSSNGGSTKPQGSSGIATTIQNPVVNQGNPVLNPNPSGFNDLGSVSWAVTAINNLYVNGVISGKAPNEFRPNDNITRAEFAKILVNAFHIPAASVSSATFTDVPTSHWASSFVETASAKGVITGYDNGAFDPDANVTRQDMAVMIYRAATAMNYPFEALTDPVTFTDMDNIAAYAQEAVTTLQKAGIANGVGDGAYEPLSTSTRAQACQMIYNVFNK